MLARHLEPLIVESLKHFPVVLLTGARQVGKSTLAQSICRSSWKGRYLTLDDRTTLDAALTNPDFFIQEISGPAVIDEVQKAPDVLRAVKLVIDRDRKPGSFLLTGSANILTLSKVSETLAGRVAVYELQPLSWAELHQRPVPSSLDDLFASKDAKRLQELWPREASEESRREIRERILSGGFPTPALMASHASRQKWFDSYRQTYLERDLRDLANIARLPDFSRLMATLSLRTGQILNHSELSRDVGLPVATLRRYLNLMGQTYQVHVVPPFSGNVAKRLVKSPKVYMADTGVACHLTAADHWETLERQNRIGAMVETWVMNELRKMIALALRKTELLYWRTRTGQEVDFLVERGAEVAGIEVKWGAGFGERDLSGLKACKDALGKRWRFGVLLHGGTKTLALDEKTLAVPFGVFFGT